MSELIRQNQFSPESFCFSLMQDASCPVSITAVNSVKFRIAYLCLGEQFQVRVFTSVHAHKQTIHTQNIKIQNITEEEEEQKGG